MMFLNLDFETKDPYIGLGLEAGFPFAVQYPEASLFYPIGFSYCLYNTEDDSITESKYLELGTKSLRQSKEHNNIQVLKDLIDVYKNVVCHNAQYDLGCLMSLGINIKNIRIYDTKVMAKLYDSSLYNYSLSTLLKLYSLGEKQTGSLGDVVRRRNLLKTRLGNDPDQSTKTYEKRCTDFAYVNMDLIQELEPATMAFYANGDTIGMAKLFKFLYSRVGDRLSQFYSNIQLISTVIRSKGNKIDMEAVDSGLEIITPDWELSRDKLYKLLGTELNLNSSKDQVGPRLVELGYKLPLTPGGNPSVNKEFLEENPNDEICKELLRYRTLTILKRDFLEKTRDMQQYSCPYAVAGDRYGRVFPQYNLLEASTGRFSCSGPNIQNIPKRDKEFAKYCRAIFVPDNEDNNWYSLDWSNQEGRLQLHYAYLKDMHRAKEWRDKFIANPKLDTHSIVAKMMGGVSRNIAKTIYLGKSFCMGKGKTAKRLGLPSELASFVSREGKKITYETSGAEATILIDKYEKAFPYLTQLQKYYINLIKEKGYIKTINGRRLKRDPYRGGKSLDYKAISKKIQGSAADQMYMALTEGYSAGIDIKCIVHDEFNIEGQDQDAMRMKEIMETCTKLVIPSVAEVKKGKSWGTLEEYNHEKNI